VPHRGFDVLRRLAERAGRSFVFTSNVDGQFQRAGFPEDSIVECHGSIHSLQCLGDCGIGVLPADTAYGGLACIPEQWRPLVEPLPVNVRL
jgi:NAD-dependent SIR2 family protein deacetylase